MSIQIRKLLKTFASLSDGVWRSWGLRLCQVQTQVLVSYRASRPQRGQLLGIIGVNILYRAFSSL